MLPYLVFLLVGPALLVSGYHLAMLQLRTNPDDLRALRKEIKDERGRLEAQQLDLEIELQSVLALARAHRSFYDAARQAARDNRIDQNMLDAYEEIAARRDDEKGDAREAVQELESENETLRSERDTEEIALSGLRAAPSRAWRRAALPARTLL